ncbi:hypothetical protein, partial [Salmonella enterica]|uniref:hypothetical protein n=1 Tax=Salmonella enterica TaxID=28901 RepID=UPI0019D59365
MSVPFARLILVTIVIVLSIGTDVPRASDANASAERTGPPSPAPLSASKERALAPQEVFQECVDCPQMVVVPAGSFVMGSPSSER